MQMYILIHNRALTKCQPMVKLFNVTIGFLLPRRRKSTCIIFYLSAHVSWVVLWFWGTQGMGYGRGLQLLLDLRQQNVLGHDIFTAHNPNQIGILVFWLACNWRNNGVGEETQIHFYYVIVTTVMCYQGWVKGLSQLWLSCQVMATLGNKSMFVKW